MAAYRADIEIGVRGQRDLERLRSLITQTTQAFESLNRIASTRGGLNQTLANYTNQVTRAKIAIDNVTMGTQAETKAIREYVNAVGAANTARARQNYLIAQEIANRRQVQAQLNAGFGIQGPALPPSTTASARRNAGPGAGRLGGVVSNAVIGGAFPLLFGQGGGAATGGAIGGLAGGLFGGAGGFAGSLLGTLLGGIVEQGAKVRQLAEDIGFSADQTKRLEAAFALAGAEADKFQASVQNIRGLGLTLDDQADAISLVSKLTESYGGKIDRVTAAYADFVEKGKVGIADINKFTSQGIPILEALEKKFGTNRDGVLALAKDGKISAQQLSDALVGIAQASDGTNKKIKTGWDKVWEDLSIGSSKSVKGIVAVFASLVGASSDITGKIASVFSGLYKGMIEGALDAGARISRTLAETARAAANYAATMELGGINFGARIAKGTAKGAEKIFTDLDKRLQEIRNTPEAKVGEITVPGQAPPPPGSQTRKPPEDKTADLLDQLRATDAILSAENQIRDLLFQNKEFKAAEVELAKELADIQRDTSLALRNANYETERQAITALGAKREVGARLAYEDKIREISKKQLEQELQKVEAIQASVTFIKEIAVERAIENQYNKTYYRLLKEGILPEEAQRIANFERTVASQLKSVELQISNKEEQIAITEASILEADAKGAVVTKLKEEIDLLKRKQKAIQDAAAGGPGPAKTNAERIKQEITAVETELATLTDPINMIIAGAQGIRDAFAQSFSGIISGSLTAQEALAGFFQGVADNFASMAAEIVSRWLQLAILNTVLKLFPSGTGPAGPAGPDIASSFTGSFKLPDYMGGASAFQMRANGGPVMSGTPYIVGERGPELFVPGRSGTIIPNDRMPTGGGVQVGTINITVENTGEQLSPQAQKQIAGQVRGIVLATLVDQQRSGGVLR